MTIAVNPITAEAGSRPRGVPGPARPATPAHIIRDDAEAIRIADAPGFALGVQWHAEHDPTTNPINRALFEAFGAAAARQRAESRRPR